MKTLKEVLEEVGGRGLVLKYVSTGSGDKVPSRVLHFRDGEWILSEIGCWSSKLLGLGACNCFSHDPIVESRISREEALSLLREHIQKLVEEERVRNEEVKFFVENPTPP